MPPTTRDSIAIPIAIVIAAGLIAGAIFFGNSNAPAQQAAVGSAQDSEPDVRQVDSTDHIRGNPNAQIVFVEYSDFDCPFCQDFHKTMQRIMDEYGSSGKIAWVYRHFPLGQLHPNAPKIAEASECVTEQGGDPAFWKFADMVFGEKPVNDFTEMSRLPEFAERAGVDRAKFESCLASGKYAEKLEKSIAEAQAAGGTGTPHTLVLVGDQIGTINGAQPYEVVKQIVENLISQMETGTVPKESAS